MKQTNHPARYVGLVGAAIGLVCAAPAQTNFFEDFESGTLANWTSLTAPDLRIATPTNVVPAGGLYAAALTNSSSRMFHSSETGLGVTAQSFKFSFWMYDSGSSLSRCYNEVRVYTGGSMTNGSLAQLYAIGKYNANGTEPNNSAKYQGRLANGSPAANWINLEANRSTGWHLFEIERGQNAYGEAIVTFFVDNKVARVVTNSAAGLPDSVILGPGIGTTAANSWFDGITLISGQAYIRGIVPESAAVSVGQPLNLQADAIGDAGPLSYQWRKGGTDIPGATDYILTVNQATFADAGNYSVVVSNLLAVKTSAVAVVTINPLNTITVQPTNQIVNLGSPVQFYAEGTGTGTIYYQWNKNGTAIPGATGMGFSSTYDIAAALETDAGNYSVTITNDAGDPPTTSSNALLTVNVPPTWTTASNQTVQVGTRIFIPLVAADDLSTQTVPFQNFESNNVGQTIMFGNATFSGTTGNYLDTNQVNRTYITNVFPAGHGGGAKVLSARWTWWSNSPPGSLRLTTASAAVTAGGNPVISYLKKISFDIYTDKELKVALGARDGNATGAYGSNSGITSGQIEWLGVSTTGTPPAATNTVPANTWTRLEFDPVNDGIASAYGTGNGILDSTTGKGTLEHLAFVPADGLPGSYSVLLDNFVVQADNSITFELVSGPSGATLDPVTGVITWDPPGETTGTFVVKATDFYGLSTTRTFEITVADLQPPHITDVDYAGGSLTVTGTGTAGRTYNLVTGALTADPATWTTAGSGTASAAGVITITITPGSEPQAFYRLKAQ